jgi:hypothetical protein
LRRRLFRSLALAALAALAFPGPALAHGFGQSYDLPIPLWLYLFGAGAAVLVSFVPVSLIAEERDAKSPLSYPRFDLFSVRPLRVVLNNGAFLFGVRLLSAALFSLVILTGLFGEQDAGLNLAPTFIWILWWVGFSFFTAFVGNLWPLVNPWKILFDWAEAAVRRLGLGKGLQLGEPYPASWGVWPAVVLYAAFVWVENVFVGSATPVYLAVLALNYSVLTWGGMVVYGKETWLRGGEVFSVFFGLLGRFAPTEVRVKGAACRECSSDCSSREWGCVNCYECFAGATLRDRELALRPPAVGLARPERVAPGGVFFVILVLAGVSFDGLLETPFWVWLQVVTGVPRTLGLVVLPLLFFAVYLLFVKLSQVLGGGTGRLRGYAAAYVFSLVPIAVAYQVAHYYTLLLVQGQAIVRHVSDPFGWGWDLFGTGGFMINAAVIGADAVWYSQIALIVAGHVVAVYLAHVTALRLFENYRRALWSQVPMLVLMVLYTVSSLWILSQPIAA